MHLNLWNPFFIIYSSLFMPVKIDGVNKNVYYTLKAKKCQNVSKTGFTNEMRSKSYAVLWITNNYASLAV